MKTLSTEAATLLLILAANGGQMDRADAELELTRVLALSPADRAMWEDRIRPLVQAHARRVLGE